MEKSIIVHTLIAKVSIGWSRSIAIALLNAMNSDVQSRLKISSKDGRSAGEYWRQWLIRSCMSGHGGQP